MMFLCWSFGNSGERIEGGIEGLILEAPKNTGRIKDARTLQPLRQALSVGFAEHIKSSPRIL